MMESLCLRLMDEVLEYGNKILKTLMLTKRFELTGVGKYYDKEAHTHNPNECTSCVLVYLGCYKRRFYHALR